MESTHTRRISQPSFPATKALEFSYENQSDLPTDLEWEGIDPTLMDMLVDEGQELGYMGGYYDIMTEAAAT